MMKTTNINPIDRINRIAMTGDIEDPKPLSPVDNIMQHYPKTNPQQEAKKEQMSNIGRLLFSGLGGGLAAGIVGGNWSDALGYGLMSAGNTADNLYKQSQDQKAWEEKEADRLFRQQENEANRQHDWDIANAKIEADRQARKDEMDRVLKTLELKDKYGAFNKKVKTPAEQLQALAKAGATPESLNMFAEANGLTGYKFEDTKPKLTGQTQLLDYMVNVLGVEPSEAVSRIAKMTPSEQLALHQGKVAIDTDGKLVIVDAQHQNAMEKQNDAQAHDVNMAGVNFDYNSKLQAQKDEAKEKQSQRDFERSLAKSEHDNELKKGFEAYKKTLPVNKVIELEQKAALMNEAGFNVTAGDLALEDYLNDVESRNKIVAETGRTNAQANYTNAQTDFVTGAKTDLTNAQINNVNARTGLTEAQTGQVGKTNDIRNAEWLAQNPNATMEQKIAMGISGSYGKAYNDAIMTGKTPAEADKIAMAKVQQDIITGQLMSGMLGGGIPNGQPIMPVYPQESENDVEYVNL
jgi:hypothetical protein